MQEASSTNFSKGWYYCYQIFLYIIAALGALGYLINFSQLLNVPLTLFILLNYILFPLAFLLLVLCEILAIRKRDLSKAELAFYGFRIFFGVQIVLLILVGFSKVKISLDGANFVYLILDVSFILIFLFGSTKVYRALSGNGGQAGNGNAYEAFNNA